MNMAEDVSKVKKQVSAYGPLGWAEEFRPVGPEEVQMQMPWPENISFASEFPLVADQADGGRRMFRRMNAIGSAILQAQRAEIPQPGPAARDMFGVGFAA